jgi:hypothetical protein
MATRADIRADYFTGEDKRLTFTVVQGGTTTPQNLTGWGLSWMVKRKYADADASAIVAKTTPTDITVSNPLTGVCTVVVSDSDISAMKAGVLYHHELKRTDAGLETVLSYGTLMLQQAVHS